MTRISCPQCDKTFRGESGLDWHLERMHSQSRQASDQVNNSANLSQAEDAAQLEDIRDSIEALEQQTNSIATSVKELDQQPTDRIERKATELERRLSGLMAEQFRLLEGSVKDLEMGQSIVKSRQDSLQSSVDSLGRRLSRLEPKPNICTGLQHPRLTCQGTKR
jgi:chromosome segregation ATPase